MTAVSEKDAVICIHDDYCIDMKQQKSHKFY